MKRMFAQSRTCAGDSLKSFFDHGIHGTDEVASGESCLLLLSRVQTGLIKVDEIVFSVILPEVFVGDFSLLRS
jgi:hypothetical protein